MFQNHVGINLTESKLQLVEISYKNNSFFLENIDQTALSRPFRAYSGEDENWQKKTLDILQDAFNKLSVKTNLTSKFSSFTLSNSFFTVFEIPYEHSLTRKDLMEHIKWEISVLYPETNPEDFLVQYIEADKSEIRKENKLIVFLLKRQLANLIKQFCVRNGLTLKYIDNAHLSSLAFFYLSKNKFIEKITFSFYIEQDYSSFMALEGVTPFYFEKYNNQSDLIASVENTVGMLSKYGVDYGKVDNFVISGQSLTDEFINKFGEKFPREIIKINPFEYFKTTEQVTRNPLYLSQRNSFTAATGIAIRIV
ncbi:hypothetical protein ACSSWA_10295 [Melioribacter sp. Ez-97]|uniref:hypothetical protein n=1 Tax=Melioribacter sp. Ez-97 TaxID=3423434 RepID=UPI003ED9F64A